MTQVSGDIAAIAAGLSDAQRATVLALSGDWQAGPDFADDVIDELRSLRDAGLVERRFGDFGEQVKSSSEHGLQVRLAACWYFRLNTTGLAVGAYLEGESNA